MTNKRVFAKSAIAAAVIAACSTAWGANQSAFNVIEGGSLDAQYGVTVSGTDVGYIDNGDWMKYTATNFGSGANKFNAWVGVDPQYAGQTLEVRLDSPTGPLVGSLVMQSTGGFGTIAKQSVQLNQTVTGVRDLYLVAKGTWGVCNLDKFQFEGPTTSRSAFSPIEAESADANSGVTIQATDIGYFDGGDWLKYNQVDFGTGAVSFTGTVAVDPAYAGQKIDIRLDSPTGTLVGQHTVQNTGGWGNYVAQTSNLNQTVTGKHDLYLVANGSWGIAGIDKFVFGATTTTQPPAPPTSRVGTDVQQAESANGVQGASIVSDHLTSVDNGDWAKYTGMAFGTTGVNKFTVWAGVDAAHANQNIEIRLDSPTGTRVGQLTVLSTGGYATYLAQSATLSQTVTGTHDVYLVGAGSSGVADVDKFQFAYQAPVTRNASSPLVYDNLSNQTIGNVIITGGTGPCITLNNPTNVTVDNVDLSQCGSDGVKIVGGTGVTVQNSNIHDLSHAVGHADGVNADGASNVVVKNTTFSNIYTDDPANPRGCVTDACVAAQNQNEDSYAMAIRFRNVAGGQALSNTFTKVGNAVYSQGSGSRQIVVDRNTATTIWGPYPRGQFVQFAAMGTSAGNKITCNKVDNSGTTWVEDAINIYQTNGSSAQPSDAVYIAYNKIRGHGPNDSSSGIQLGDSGGNYIRVEGNRLVNPGTSGIGISGTNSVVVNNKLFRDSPDVHVGLYTNDHACPATGSGNIFAYNQLQWGAKDVGAWIIPFRIKDWDGTDRGCNAYDTTSPSTATTFVPSTVIPTNEAPGTNQLNQGTVTSAIWDEVIPQCN